jgi:ketosteroid isomerase-like protein
MGREITQMARLALLQTTAGVVPEHFTSVGRELHHSAATKGIPIERSKCMRHLALIALLAAASVFVVGKDKFSSARYENLMTEQTLINIEKSWNAALVSNDLAAVSRIVADDWVGIDFKGAMTSKEETLAQLKSGESRNEYVELGDVNVRVYGDTAVVTGTDTEKSVYQGQNTNGRYAFTDVFVKKDGRWQAVASQSTRIVPTWLDMPIPTN